MTTGAEKLLALISISILGYDYFIGGLPKIVLFIACMGLLVYFLAFLKAWYRR